MATEIKRVTFEEFAADVAGFFDRVTHDKETITVEKGPGEVVVLEPAPASSDVITKKSKEEIEAFLSSAGAWKSLVDTDKLIADIYESRKSSRPPVDL